VYLTREQSISALGKMKVFHSLLCEMYLQYGMNLKSNLGRRNILMSGPQEVFFAEELRKTFPGATSNGRTGEADILIPELEKELECKLTTRYQSTGALAFQSDSMSFQDKPNGLDFLYVVADEDFESFAVLHFLGLNREDFHKEAPGARGRVRMKKHMGMLKCDVLFGDVIDRRDQFIQKYEEELGDVLDEWAKRATELESRLQTEAPAKARKTSKTIENAKIRFDKKVISLQEKIRSWQEKDSSYTVNLEKLLGDKNCQNLICAA
tara:strand:+ start:3610 stop:4407 length:798 start_codon:yes stop_codon:yes gene_type:complete